jgi:Uncharacterized protein conserved in bacteria (DUF2252)
VFSVNDFDETLPGPFEWDVKRLAASFAVPGRDSGFTAKDRRKIVLAAAESYRRAMREFAGQPLLAVWYAHLDIEDEIGQFKCQIKAKRLRAAEKLVAKAHTKDSTQAFGKLTTMMDGRRRIISDPPTIMPVEEVFADVQAEAIYQQIRGVLGKYRRSLQSARRHLLEQFTLVQVARTASRVLKEKPVTTALCCRRYWKHNLKTVRRLGAKRGGVFADGIHFRYQGGQVRSLLSLLSYLGSGEYREKYLGIKIPPTNLQDHHLQEARNSPTGWPAGWPAPAKRSSNRGRRP